MGHLCANSGQSQKFLDCLSKCPFLNYENGGVAGRLHSCNFNSESIFGELVRRPPKEPIQNHGIPPYLDVCFHDAYLSYQNALG